MVQTVCRSCGKPRSGGNLVTPLDVYTQDAFLTEDGYLFINPYWHSKLIPDPESYEDIIKLLHKEKKVDKNNELNLAEEHEGDTVISLKLYKFKFIWIYTDQVLTSVPYEHRDYFMKATFFLRSRNEILPTFDWVKSAIEARYNCANYERDFATGDWKQKDSATVGDPREIPTDKELEFLKETEKLVNKYTKDYILQFEELRTCYTQEYLDEVKKVVNKYSSDKWNLQIPGNKDIRANFHFQLERFVKHLENKLDLTRKGYELYKPVDFKKVDEFKTLIHLGRDFVAEWYPMTYRMTGMWQFCRRPLSKKKIEEWEKLEYEDGSTRTIPLRSCVFCPSDAGLSSSRSDDFAFDSRVLIGIKRGMREALKGTWQSGQKEMQRMYLLENLNEIAAQLASASTDDLSKLKDEELTVILTSINGLKGEEGLSQGANDDFETIIKIIEEEIKRRGKEKEFLEKLKQEMEQDRTQREADRRRQRDLEQQIDRARAEGNQNLINELQGQLNETSDRINTADNQIRNGQEQATRLEAAINSSNERTRNYAQNMQSVLEDILQGNGISGSFPNFFNP